MKKFVSFITCIAMCMMLVMPVSAAEIKTEDSITMTEESEAALYSTNYFRKITPKVKLCIWLSVKYCDAFIGICNWK